jgi:hypothetical protein
MINFDDRLKSLKDRRQGTAERDRLAKSMSVFAGDTRSHEAYELLKQSAAIKYVIGAMAPVSSESSRISKEEGERVATTLIELLKTSGINAEMRMQGSVVLDTHIEGYSDVDMLILMSDTFTIQGPPLLETNYVDSVDKRPMTDIIRELRVHSEQKLQSRYHAATVNINGRKSISLTGGSLKRKVDIVPSTWHDTHEYQRTRAEHFRAVRVYDKLSHELIENKPFLHASRINERDVLYGGNLKKAIRLMKNVIADLPEYKKIKAKTLTSYDVAGIAYAMQGQLECSKYLPLTLLENLRAHLLLLIYLEDNRNSLMVPDGTRKIFDSEAKIEALNILSRELDDLAMSTLKAIAPFQSAYDGSLLKNTQIVFF